MFCMGMKKTAYLVLFFKSRIPKNEGDNKEIQEQIIMNECILNMNSYTL